MTRNKLWKPKAENSHPDLQRPRETASPAPVAHPLKALLLTKVQRKKLLTFLRVIWCHLPRSSRKHLHVLFTAGVTVTPPRQKEKEKVDVDQSLTSKDTPYAFSHPGDYEPSHTRVIHPHSNYLCLRDPR